MSTVMIPSDLLRKHCDVLMTMCQTYSLTMQSVLSLFTYYILFLGGGAETTRYSSHTR